MSGQNPVPTLLTSRLVLRELTLEDVKPLHRILNEPDILRYFPHPDSPDMERVQSLVQLQFTHWQEHKFGWWAVILRERSELIGWSGLGFLPETEEVEVAYLLSRPFWGQGFGTEGARAALNFGFDTLDLPQIIGLTHPDNTASQNVLQKCGMRFIEQKEYFGLPLFRFVLNSPIKNRAKPLCRGV
jgi:ribosomal-protein-alanine N-acetyltransferase